MWTLPETWFLASGALGNGFRLQAILPLARVSWPKTTSLRTCQSLPYKALQGRTSELNRCGGVVCGQCGEVDIEFEKLQAQIPSSLV